MENPIKIAVALKDSISHALANIAMADGPKSVLSGSLEKTKNIIKELENIHKNFVPLDPHNTNNKKLFNNLNYWIQFRPGLIHDRKEIEKLLSKSSTLDTFYRKGIDILNIYKFTEEEIDFSNEISRIFFKDVVFLSRLKHGMHEGNFTIWDKGLPHIKGILNKLIKKEIISEYKEEYLDSKSINISFKLQKTEYRIFFEGHWFEAYTYTTVFEFLKRNRFDFEIYTRVSYKSPTNISTHSGEFDIISMVEDKVLLIECKSGHILNDFEVQKIITKTESLREIFDSCVKNYNYEFILVHNPKIVFTDKNIEKLQNANINMVNINDIRGAIERIFGKNNN